MPEADLSEMVILQSDTQGKRLMRGYAADAEEEIIERDPAIGIGRALGTEAEDIFGGLEGWFEAERAEEGLFVFQGFLETAVRDFTCSGVNTAVIIIMDFLGEDLVSRCDRGDIFADTGTDEMVLEPAVGTFDFTFGLRGEGIDWLDATVDQDLSPLGIGFIGEAVMSGMEFVTAPDESKDRVAVDVVGVGVTIAQGQSLQGFYVSPDSFAFHEFGIEEIAGEVVERGDKVPLDGSCWSPEVVRGVVLDEFPGIAG